MVDAGIRVQALKKADHGAIYFGTEVFTDSHHSLAALLGASPGASVSVNIARELILNCFPQLLEHAVGRARMKEMLTTYDEDLKQPCNAGLFEKLSARAEETLQLRPVQDCRTEIEPPLTAAPFHSDPTP